MTIDGLAVEINDGARMLDAAASAGIEIPTLCWMKDLNIIGSCRVCLVDLEGEGLVTACETPAREGMVVRTNSDMITAYRKEMLNLILANHNLDCMSCPANGACRLQNLCNEYGIKHSPYEGFRTKIDQKIPVRSEEQHV